VVRRRELEERSVKSGEDKYLQVFGGGERAVEVPRVLLSQNPVNIPPDKNSRGVIR
jgi:hypothetical protein